MTGKKSTIAKKEIKEEKIVEEWTRISKEYHFSGLSELEKAQFKKAQFAEKQAKETHFVLGEPIRHSF